MRNKNHISYQTKYLKKLHIKIMTYSCHDLLIGGVKEWDVHKIAEMFYFEGVSAIIQTLLFPSVQEDKVVWQEESNGLYSVRSGYRIAAREVVPSAHYYVHGEWNLKSSCSS